MTTFEYKMNITTPLHYFYIYSAQLKLTTNYFKKYDVEQIKAIVKHDLTKNACLRVISETMYIFDQIKII